MRKSTSMNVLFIVLLVLASLLLLTQVANLLSMHASDPFGRGLSQAFGAFLSIGLWVLLAGLCALARTKGAFPSFSGWAVLVLLPASLAAMLVTNSLFESTLSSRWLVIPVAAPPVLLTFFAIALWVPALRSGVLSFEMNCAVWGAVLLMAALPWFFARKQSKENAGYAAELEMQRQTEDQTRHERFAKLNSNSPLAEWLKFAEWGSDVRDQALAGIRQLPHRQSEAESLLAKGTGVILELLPVLDLEATPTLCLHARNFFRDFVKSFAEPEENPNSLALAAHRLERYASTLTWFCRRHGDVAEVLDSIEGFARRHPDSPERMGLLSETEKLRQLSR
jgi:hypothetical protein